MQSVSSRIWTRVAVSISYNDNHYTMGTSFKYILMIPVNYLQMKQILALDNPQGVNMPLNKPNQTFLSLCRSLDLFFCCRSVLVFL